MNREKLLGIPVVIILLELLPFSAVKSYSTENIMPVKELTTCFSLAPYHNGNYGPFVAAMLSILMLLLAVLLVLLNKGFLRKALTGVSSAALLVCLFTLTCRGWSFAYATIIGAVLPFLILAELAFALGWDTD